MMLTDHHNNQVPFVKPGNYNERNYELLFRNYEAAPNGIIEDMYDYELPVTGYQLPGKNRTSLIIVDHF